MQLDLNRNVLTPESTIGELSINGEFFCYVLEDVDRGLDQSMPLSEIKEKKVFGKTAIPRGTYTIAITWSDRFKKYLPLIMEVPGYVGIRIHPGNFASDTEGCLLPGKISSKPNEVLSSRATFQSLFSKLKAVEKTEKIKITIC